VVVKRFVHQNLDLDAQCLFVAVTRGDCPMCAHLLSSDSWRICPFTVDEVDPVCKASALHAAVTADNLMLVKRLVLDWGADTKTHDMV
jgi:hypothetical protein